MNVIWALHALCIQHRTSLAREITTPSSHRAGRRTAAFDAHAAKAAWARRAGILHCDVFESSLPAVR